MPRPSFDHKEMGKRLEHAIYERNVPIATMSRLVNGKVPRVSVRTIAKICEDLEIRLEWLVLGIEPMDASDFKQRSV